jgi:DNA-binding NarL/FixJ family response regulator
LRLRPFDKGRRSQRRKSGHRAWLNKRPDVTIIDINLPDFSGFELMRRIRKDDPAAKIIMFSMNDDPAFVVRAVEAGAQGYVSKGDDPRLLVKAVRKVAAGENFITPHRRNRDVRGRGDPRQSGVANDAARTRNIAAAGARRQDCRGRRGAWNSYKTVANTTSLLKQKLGARNHSDLIRIAVEMGMD